jgi:hypothetical protein
MPWLAPLAGGMFNALPLACTHADGSRPPRRPGAGGASQRKTRTSWRQQQLGRNADHRSANFRTTRPDQRDPRQDEANRGDRGRPDGEFCFDNIRELVGEGHNQYVDDGFTSRDGRLVFFSRPSFADVVALDLKSHRIAGAGIDGYRAAARARRMGVACWFLPRPPTWSTN